MELEGRRILVTGATGGIGRAIARELADKGSRLVLSSRKRGELEELARSLPGGRRRHKILVVDLARSGAAARLVEEAGDLDALVANAGLPAGGRLERFKPREVERALRVNLESPIQMTHALVPRLIEKGEGHLVYISSLNSWYATARSALYSATKFGLRGFALGLREDLAERGIGVSVVSPGLVREAGLFADSGAKAPPYLGATTPRKVGQAVVRAIRRNRSEVAVAPIRQIRLARFAGRHPELVGRLIRRSGQAAVADKVVAGQTAKR